MKTIKWELAGKTFSMDVAENAADENMFERMEQYMTGPIQWIPLSEFKARRYYIKEEEKNEA